MKNGVDISKIDRFNELVNNQSFLNKYFTEPEKEYIKNKGSKPETLAGIFSAKEAVLKALGIGMLNGLSFLDLCILHDKNGEPFVEVDAKLNYYLSLHNCSEISISISHDGEYAIAFCVIS